MAGTNDFLAFATAGGADVISQAAYAGLAERSSGFVTGEAATGEVNKVWRQAAFAAAALGKIISDSNRNALDDGNLTTFTANLLAAIADLVQFRLPPGAVLYYTDNVTPPGRFVAGDGQLLDRAGTYADLFGVVGTTYNVGGEAGDKFRLPDLRGVVIRGHDALRGLDPARVFGSFQTDQIKAHAHTVTALGDSSSINRYLYGSTDVSPDLIATLDNKSSNTSDAPLTSSTGGTEVRVKNIALRGFLAY